MAARRSAEEAARDWIENAANIPTNIGYDWLPFCTALAEHCININPSFNPTDATTGETKSGGNLPGYPDSFTSAYGPIRHNMALEVDPRTIPGRTRAKDGDFLYWRYIPEWMDPDYDENTIKLPDGQVFMNTVRDSLYNLRPALRLEDAIRRPTDLAKRWGIHPYRRTDGRSQTSPTLSSTRNPFDDYMATVNYLPDEERMRCEDMIRRLGMDTNNMTQENKTLLEAALKEAFDRHGAIGPKELEGSLRDAITQGRSFENWLENMTVAHPDALKPYDFWLKQCLQDQEWQRLLFADLTMDELIRLDIYDPSGSAVDELTNEIHPIFQLHKWEGSEWKGASEEAPRYCYSIGGERHEYNVHTNHALWDALQPALKLASLIIQSKHPQIEALLNLYTRQRIPNWQDPRRLEDARTPNLVKYVLEDDMDLNKGWPELQALHAMGYDWKQNTWAVLEQFITWDIGTIFVHPDSAEYQKSSAYAVTTKYDFGDHSKILMSIGAELIWPLMVPDYSPREKLTASFQIAVVMLHEMSHGIHSAHKIMTGNTFNLHPADQSPAVTNLIRSLRDELFDTDFYGEGEPFFDDNAVNEVGQGIEHGIFGRSISSATQGFFGESFARFIQPMPFILHGAPYPFPDASVDECLRGILLPPTSTYTPVKMADMQKLFLDSFWKGEFADYGHDAIKFQPDSRLQMSLMRTTVFSPTEGTRIFGDDDWRFLRSVTSIMLSTRFGILGSYLSALQEEALNEATFFRRTLRELRSWRNETMAPLMGATDDLILDLHKGEGTVPAILGDDSFKLRVFRQEQMNGNVDGNQTFHDWYSSVVTNFEDHFRIGGVVMAGMRDVHRYAQLELNIMQRIVFEFLLLRPENRREAIQGNSAVRPGPMTWIQQRLAGFQVHMQTIALAAERLTHCPALQQLANEYAGFHGAFQRTLSEYNMLLRFLGHSALADPADKTWMTHFHRLPSSYSKKRSLRLQPYAEREFSGADPRIRATVGRAIAILQRSPNPAFLDPDQAVLDDLNQVTDLLQRNYDPQTGQAINSMPTIFTFNPPPNPLNPVPAAAVGPQPQPAQPSVTVSLTPNGVQFGRPATRTAPQNITPSPADPNSGQHAGFGKYKWSYLNVQSSAPVPGPEPPAATSSQTEPRTFQGRTPIPSAPSSQVPNSIFGPGGPIGQPTPLGAGNPNRINPFPNPYAVPSDLTRDLGGVYTHLAEVSKRNRSLNAPGTAPYQAAGSWRENGSNGIGGFSDDEGSGREKMF
ncbi:hypothetical protein F5Y15DRAFT_423229 [Xylariaceae sp. FL0016]|nr:hypothetical protein F5Y15DRAFT_423229 [Xylariaceae sp. FL0016]